MGLRASKSKPEFRGPVATFLLALLILGYTAGCRPAVVRVQVSAEDIANANAATVEGDLAFFRKDYYAALLKYLRAGELNPNNPHVFNKIGIAYSRLKFYDKAIPAFDRAVGLDPKYSYAYNNMGSVHFAVNNKKKAEKYFRKAISLNNNDAAFHINLGTLLLERKKFDKALQELRKGLSLNPEILKQAAGDSLVASTGQKNAEKSYYLARFLASMGDVDNAVEHLQQALTEGFTDIEALRNEKDFDPIRHDEKFIAFLKYAAQFIK